MSYPDPLPARIPFFHAGTVSSSGKQTTAAASSEIDFSSNPLNSLEITAHADDFHVRLNAETNSHLVQSGGSMLVDKFQVTKLTIIEAGAEYSYSGAYFREV